MGVWERSPAGLAIALRTTELRRAFRGRAARPRPGDVVGSPYCVRRYVVDDRARRPRRAWPRARAELAERGRRLVLDYVPNHVAPDHPWVTEHPSTFVPAPATDLARDPAAWFDGRRRSLAHGRDPYFPPWPDVVQLNAFSPGLRAATATTLRDIADQCDGVRCDMAMLLINDVFARDLGRPRRHRAGQRVLARGDRARAARPPRLRAHRRGLLGPGVELQQQGFDFCYDKRLYDRLVDEDADGVRGAPARRPGLPATAACASSRTTTSRGRRRPARRPDRAAAVADRDPARAPPCGTRAVRGPPGAPAGLPRPRARTNPPTLARRLLRRLLAASPRPLRTGDWSCSRRPAGRTTTPPQPPRLVLARRRVATSRRRGQSVRAGCSVPASRCRGGHFPGSRGV